MNRYQSLLNRQREFFFTGEPRSAAWRLQQRAQMEKLLRDNQQALCDALYSDFRKQPFEQLFEIAVPLLDPAIAALAAGNTVILKPANTTPRVARLLDELVPRCFAPEAGHNRFTQVDHLSDDRLELRGAFHSDPWDNFRTYFRFTLAGGKVQRLDIGQA